MLKPELCYLCGKPLADEPANDDHAPPQQIFPPALRKAHNLSRLLTIPAHTACNTAYKKDEEYFVHTLMPFARGSVAGTAIYDHVLKAYRAGHNPLLVKKVLNEFEPRPSGLVLPGGKVVKRFDGERLARVAWKIVRGLYFHHHGTVLPEHHTTWVSVTPPDQKPPDHFLAFMSLPESKEYGEYPGIFAYRFDNFTEGEGENPPNSHYWALLLWDRIIVTVLFHDPKCACSNCVGQLANVG